MIVNQANLLVKSNNRASNNPVEPPQLAKRSIPFTEQQQQRTSKQPRTSEDSSSTTSSNQANKPTPTTTTTTTKSTPPKPARPLFVSLLVYVCKYHK